MKTQVEMMKPGTLEAAMDLAVSFAAPPRRVGGYGGLRVLAGSSAPHPCSTGPHHC